MSSLIEPKRPDNARVFLGRYGTIERRCKAIAEKIVDMQRWMPSHKMDAPRVKGSRRTDGVASAAVEIADAQEQLAEDVAAMNAALLEIRQAIAALPDELEKEVLTLRYINGLPWEKIAHRMSYERSSVFVIHGRAIQHIERWINERGIP